MSEVSAPQLLRQSHPRMSAEDGGRSPAVPARRVSEYHQTGKERRSALQLHLQPLSAYGGMFVRML